MQSVLLYPYISCHVCVYVPVCVYSQADDARQRALREMMNSTCEVKKTHTEDDTLKRQPWMDLPRSQVWGVYTHTHTHTHIHIHIHTPLHIRTGARTTRACYTCADV